MKTSQILIFRPTYSSSGSQVVGANPGSLEHKAGTHPIQDTLHAQGHSPTPILTQTKTRETHQFTSCAHLWDMGGNGNTMRKLTETWEKVQTPYRL